MNAYEAFGRWYENSASRNETFSEDAILEFAQVLYDEWRRSNTALWNGDKDAE